MEECHAPQHHLLAIRQLLVAKHADIVRLGHVSIAGQRCTAQADQHVLEKPDLAQLQQASKQVEGAGILGTTQQYPEGFTLSRACLKLVSGGRSKAQRLHIEQALQIEPQGAACLHRMRFGNHFAGAQPPVVGGFA
ncbi:hypothetical protein D3C71_1523010 [compost metagenome]